MVKKEVIVKSVTGLHARPGTDLVKLALSFDSNITLEKDGNIINGKEVFEIMTAAINCGDKIVVITEGTDEIEALEKIAEYIETVEG